MVKIATANRKQPNHVTTPAEVNAQLAEINANLFYARMQTDGFDSTTIF